MTLHGMIFIVSSLSSQTYSFIVNSAVMTRFSAEYKAEQHNKHAQVLAIRQALSLKKGANFVSIKKVTNFICFSNFPCKQQHFNVTNGKLVHCFPEESIFFQTKLI